MAHCLPQPNLSMLQHRQQAAPSCGGMMQRRCVPHASLLPRRGRAVMQALPEGTSASGGAIATAARAAAAIAAAGLLLAAPPALANREKVGEFAASGFIFKDTVEVNAIDDPEVRGVTIYLSDFKRSIVDKMSKDFFAEPSQASLGCAISGPVVILDEKKISGREGQEVFSEKKGLNLFKDKTLRVRRIYDDERRTLVYVAYSTRLSTAADDGQVTTGRYKTSLCIISIPQPAPAVTVSPPAADLSVTPPAPTPVAAAAQ